MCVRVTDLVLFEVTQSFDDDRAAGLLLWVTRPQTHDVLGLADQRLNLPLTVNDPVFFFLHTHTHTGTITYTLVKNRNIFCACSDLHCAVTSY